jgi:hypothetical protein
MAELRFFEVGGDPVRIAIHKRHNLLSSRRTSFTTMRSPDIAHVAAIPDRLKHRIGKPGIEDVLHGFLAKIMVDPEDAILRKVLVQDPI